MSENCQPKLRSALTGFIVVSLFDLLFIVVHEYPGDYQLRT